VNISIVLMLVLLNQAIIISLNMLISFDLSKQHFNQTLNAVTTVRTLLHTPKASLEYR